MKILAILAGLMLASTAQAQFTRTQFDPDLLIGVTKVYDGGDKLIGETLKNVGIGVAYKWQEYNPITGKWNYTVAVGGHVILGGVGGDFELGLEGDVMFFDGWLIVGGGYDFDRAGAFGLVGTNFTFNAGEVF